MPPVPRVERRTNDGVRLPDWGLSALAQAVSSDYRLSIDGLPGHCGHREGGDEARTPGGERAINSHYKSLFSLPNQ